MSDFNECAVRYIYISLPKLATFFPFLYLFMWNCLPLIIVTKAYSAGDSRWGFLNTKKKKIDEWTIKLVMFFIKIMCSLGAFTPNSPNRESANNFWMAKLFFDFFSQFHFVRHRIVLDWRQSCVFSWWQFNPTFLPTNTHTRAHSTPNTKRNIYALKINTWNSPLFTYVSRCVDTKITESGKDRARKYMHWMENWRNHLSSFTKSCRSSTVEKTVNVDTEAPRTHSHTHLLTKEFQTISKYPINTPPYFLLYTDDIHFALPNWQTEKWYQRISIRRAKLKWWIYIFVMNKQARFTAKHIICFQMFSVSVCSHKSCCYTEKARHNK